MAFQLITSRFCVRPFQGKDAVDMFNMNKDPEVIQYTGDLPFESLEATKRFLETYYERQKRGTGRWAIVDRNNGEFVGWTGIKFEPDTGLYDLGYRLYKHHWGKGIATETSAACVNYAFAELMVPALVGRVMHANIASVNVLEKLGFTYVREDFCQHHPARMFELNRKNYDQGNTHRGEPIVS